MKDALEMGWSERTVTVDRPKLIATLNTNRAVHQREYAESLAGYKTMAKKKLTKEFLQAVKSLEANHAMLNTKIDSFDPDEPVSDQVTLLQQVSFRLRVPQDHTKAYDVAIKMAEWEVSETVELTQSQFQCFVMDDWDWKEDFALLSKTYRV